MKNSILAAAALLGLSLMTAGNASAYSHSMVNRSPFKMRFQVNYKACSNDTWELKPGELITWRSGLCCISSLSAKADFPYGSTRINKPRVPGDAEHYLGQQIFDMIGMGSFFNILCSNTNWALTAEAPDTDGNAGFVHMHKL